MIRRQSGDFNTTAPDAKFEAPKRVASSGRQRSSGVTTHLAWAGGGFVLGAICWHMVGFWTFIDRVLDETRPAHHAVFAAGVTPTPVSLGKSAARLISYSSEADCVQRVSTDERDSTTVQPCDLPVVAMQRIRQEQ